MMVVLLTHSGDVDVPDRVASALRARGAEAVRVDSDTIPGRARLGVGRGGADSWLETEDTRLALDAVGAVWSRRIWPPRLPAELGPATAEACRAESLAALEGALRGPRTRWVNDPDADVAASKKLRQLRVAAAVGLDVPETLVTNDGAALRAFVARQPSVTKLVAMDHVGGRRAYTRRLTVADLDDDEGLSLAPVLVQAEVPKVAELRVSVVGGRCFTGAMRAAVDAEVVDWRHPDAGDLGWEPWQLDPGVAERLVALTRALGLVYGAVDLAVRPDGGVTFFEINPCGEWGMLARDLGLPVAEALADALLERP